MKRELSLMIVLVMSIMLVTPALAVDGTDTTAENEDCSSALTQVLSGKGLITGAVLAAGLLKDYGIGTANSVILGDFNPIVSIRSYGVKYRTTMRPENTDVDMCIEEI